MCVGSTGKVAVRFGFKAEGGAGTSAPSASMPSRGLTCSAVRRDGGRTGGSQIALRRRSGRPQGATKRLNVAQTGVPQGGGAGCAGKIIANHFAERRKRKGWLLLAALPCKARRYSGKILLLL